MLSEFSKYNFGGQLWPTNTVARRLFRAMSGNQANGVVKACLNGNDNSCGVTSQSAVCLIILEEILRIQPQQLSL